jgi:prepilin-type N-terminal cleavage/methylation domain-containing protein
MAKEVIPGGVPGFAEGVMVMMRKINPKRLARARSEASPAAGFTLIEVLVSMLITLIVMSAVFGLLSRGQSTFQREPEIADMQQSARAALDMVSKDALQAGAGLPPEFPAFTTPAIDAAVGDTNPDTIEIVGGLAGAGEMNAEPNAVLTGSWSGDLSSSTFKTVGQWSGLEVGDLVVLYEEDGTGLDAYWIMSYIQGVQPDGGAPVRMDITLAPDPPAGAPGGSVPANYQGRTAAIKVGFDPAFVTQVTVVRYFTQPDPNMTLSGPPPNALMRTVNFGPANPVAYLEDFQVFYLAGGTTAADQRDDPPDPHIPGTAINPADVINGVTISVAARSLTQNLQGATETANPADGNFIRKTFSSNVSPRNILAGLAGRCFQATGQPCWH